MARWFAPIAFQLVPTADSDSWRNMPAGCTGLPRSPHPGAFGVRRRHHTHEGVDLYVPAGTCVFAVEQGAVVAVLPFTGTLAGLPWWLDTWAVFVEGPSGVVVYGEIEASVCVGDSLQAGDALGSVVPVLRENKGRPMSMLHLELHTSGSRLAPEWLEDDKPSVLRDPTPYLLLALGHAECSPK